MIFFLSPKVVSILANRADPDEMQHYAAFHPVLHCLPKYPIRGFQYIQRVTEDSTFASTLVFHIYTS